MDVAELVAYLGLAIDEDTWNKGLELIEKTRAGVEKLGGERKKAEKEEREGAGALKDALEEGLESYFGYEGIKTIEELVEHTMEATIAAKHLGERLGVTTEAVQGLGYAASVTGASSGAMTSALQRLSFGLQQTGLHGHGAASALQKLHLSASEMKKLPLDEQLGVIADKFKAMKDGPEKVAIAMQLFGRQAGPQLVPLLNQGKDGIEALRKEAEELGVTTGEENVEKAEKLERAQKQLQARWGAMKDTLAFALIPVITTLTGALSQAVAFLRDNDKIIIAALAGIASAIGYIAVVTAIAHAELLSTFASFMIPIMAVVYVVETLADAFDNGFTVMSGVIIALGTLVVSFFAAAVGASLPLTAVFIAIGAGLILLYRHFDEVKEAIVGAWNYVVDLFEESSPAIKAAIFVAFLPISMTILAIKELIEHWEDLKDAVGGTFAGIGSPDELIARAKGAQSPERDGGTEAAGSGTGAEGGGTTKLEVHAPVTINANGDPATIHKYVKEHHEKVVSDAYRDHKKGG